MAKRNKPAKKSTGRVKTKAKAAGRSRPTPSSVGTAVLGRVIPELVAVAYSSKDSDIRAVADRISQEVLMHFQVEMMKASGMFGPSDE